MFTTLDSIVNDMDRAELINMLSDFDRDDDFDMDGMYEDEDSDDGVDELDFDKPERPAKPMHDFDDDDDVI